MKKRIFAFIFLTSTLFSSEVTITATMNLMNQGMNQIQAGFLNNNKNSILEGIKIIENANDIFSQVDVSTFIPNNKKVQVTKNIHNNLTKSLQQLKNDIENKRYTEATASYGKTLSTCISCHTIVRSW